MPDTHSQISFEQPRSMFSTWVGVGLLFALFGLLVWAVLIAMPRTDDYEAKRAAARLEKLKTVREEASAALHGYGWIDKEKGAVRLPIERAMELTLAELAQKKPAPANPIPPDASAGGPQTTAPAVPVSAAPAPVASPTPKIIKTEGEGSEINGQPAGAANPPDAAPNTQPGASTTPPGPPPSQTRQFQPDAGSHPIPTPMQSPAGTPIPIPGKTP